MTPFPPSPHVDQQQACADGDAAIGDVEVRKVIAFARMKLDEIGDGVAYDAIVEISKSAPENERQGNSHQGAVRLTGAEEDRGDYDQHGGRESDQDKRSQRPGRVREEAESNTWVFIVYDVEKTGDHGKAIAMKAAVADEKFREVIEEEDERGDEEGSYAVDHGCSFCVLRSAFGVVCSTIA